MNEKIINILKEKPIIIPRILFLKYKESADFLATVARRGRKYNTPLLIGSQFIDEFINCEER